jgi:catechol 2,3-dioxygenase-like lactoylglutathione lyase family enzyme
MFGICRLTGPTPSFFFFMAIQPKTKGGFKQAQPTYPGGSTFTPFNVGLDHIAIACEDEAELHRVADALQAAGVENTGVKQDTVGPMKYVAFKDPDRIAWEFYMV